MERSHDKCRCCKKPGHGLIPCHGNCFSFACFFAFFLASLLFIFHHLFRHISIFLCDCCSQQRSEYTQILISWYCLVWCYNLELCNEKRVSIFICCLCNVVGLSMLDEFASMRRRKGSNIICLLSCFGNLFCQMV